MRRSFDRRSTRLSRTLLHRIILLTFVVFVSFAFEACNGEKLKAELLPGTERIEPGDNDTPWFTISPNERYLAFMEVDSSDWGEEATKYHMVTLDLTTSAKTHHHLRELPPRTLGNELFPWQYVRMGFEVAGWEHDRVLVRIQRNSPRTRWLTFIPGAPGAKVASAPTTLGCTDCAPPEQWRSFAESHGLPFHIDDVKAHIPYRSGRFSDVVYRVPLGRNFRGAVVERVHSDGSVDVLLEQKRAGKRMYVGHLRVSPDEQYLAYELVSELKSPIPLPTMRDELVVRHLPTGVERRVPGTYRVMGNLIWSADSKRLYYAAVDGAVADGTKDGVYRIDFARDD